MCFLNLSKPSEGQPVYRNAALIHRARSFRTSQTCEPEVPQGDALVPWLDGIGSGLCYPWCRRELKHQCDDLQETCRLFTASAAGAILCRDVLLLPGSRCICWHQEQQLAQLLEHHGADKESKMPGQCSFLSLLLHAPNPCRRHW